MATKNPQSPKAKLETIALSLRQINGINQLIEARLHRSGITTVEQLAKLSPKEIFKALGNHRGLSVEQIIEQDWLGQARKLLGENGTDTIASEGFIINLFLSKNKRVTSTQILHVNSDEGEKWDRWDGQQILDFIARQSGIVLPKPEAIETKAKKKMQTAMTHPQLMELPLSAITAEKSPEKPEPNPVEIPVTVSKPKAEAAPAVSSKPRTIAPPSTPSRPLPDIVFRTMEIIPSQSIAASQLRSGEAFDVRVEVDCADLLQQAHIAFNYQAMIFAKGMGGRQMIPLGEAQGVVAKAGEPILVHIPQQDLQPGLYRLEAAVTLSAAGLGSRSVTNPVRSNTFFQVY